MNNEFPANPATDTNAADTRKSLQNPNRSGQLFRHLLLALAFVWGLLGLQGCERDGPVENAAENVDDALEETGDEIDDAADRARDAAQDAADNLEDAADELNN